MIIDEEFKYLFSFLCPTESFRLHDPIYLSVLCDCVCILIQPSVHKKRMRGLFSWWAGLLSLKCHLSTQLYIIFEVHKKLTPGSTRDLYYLNECVCLSYEWALIPNLFIFCLSVQVSTLLVCLKKLRHCQVTNFFMQRHRINVKSGLKARQTLRTWDIKSKFIYQSCKAGWNHFWQLVAYHSMTFRLCVCVWLSVCSLTTSRLFDLFDWNVPQ